MYEIGDRVIYAMHGVCRITGQEEQASGGKRLTYLALEPEGQPGSKYLVPTHNEAAMKKIRPMLTREGLQALLQSPVVLGDAWIPEENLRKNRYRELIGSGDREQLLAMVRALYRHKERQAAAGKRCHICDENFLRDAERLLCSEFSMVLETDTSQVRKYLKDQLC